MIHGQDARRPAGPDAEVGPDPRGTDNGRRRGGRVWLTAQRSPRAQREGLFVPESIAHPARMGPDLAAHIIARYTRPGDWVLDPMCGIGTTVVQAVRTGRQAIGVEYEPRWVRIGRANLALARADGHHSSAHLVQGDARKLRTVLPPELVRRVAMVLTSPPYGRGVHGHLTSGGGSEPIGKRHHRYAPTPRDRANLAYSTAGGLAAGMTAILTEAAAVLRPGGVVVMVVRPWRDRGSLVDLPEQMITCARDAGLDIVDRAAALHGRIDEHSGELVARQSFFQSLNVSRARAAGEPTHLIAHEDVLIATVSTAGTSAGRTAAGACVKGAAGMEVRW